MVGDSEPPAPLQLAIRCRRSGRILALTTLTKEDYTSWMSALSETVREWREKRRASVLNRQIMAIGMNLIPTSIDLYVLECFLFYTFLFHAR